MQLFRHRYFLFSSLAHLFVLLFIVLSFDHQSSLVVFENTNKNEMISAVVLGDTAKSKIINPPAVVNKPNPENPVVKKPQNPLQKDAIALTVEKKKKPPSFFEKDLLADIQKQKKVRQKQIKAKFEKTLRETAEQSLREQLLNEEIKLKGVVSHQSQGEVNKYKALILQAISEQWIIPLQANRKLFCELMIRLAPGGMVLDVQVIKTSGDPSLDSSARAAVMKASPLPVPEDKAAFESFRQFVLKVKPENVLENV